MVSKKIMDLQVTRKVWLTLTVIAVAVILLLSIGVGYNKGKVVAESELVENNAKTLTAGLGYFFQDQDRYPTALEFQNELLMGSYFLPFPPQEFASGSCSTSFIYKRPSPSEYQLLYCLNKDIMGQTAGWHKLEGHGELSQ